MMAELTLNPGGTSVHRAEHEWSNAPRVSKSVSISDEFVHVNRAALLRLVIRCPNPLSTQKSLFQLGIRTGRMRVL
jgi:hypothetical protein